MEDENEVTSYAVWDAYGTVAIGFDSEEEAQEYLESLY